MRHALRAAVASFVFGATFIASGAQAQESRAGFFLEPGITYELGETSIDYPAPFENSSGEANGFGAVVRGGMHVNEILFLGLDARYSWIKFEDSTNNMSSSGKAYTLAPVIGAQVPNLGARVWGGYIVNAEMDPEQAGQIDLKFKEGQGYILGAGFRVASVSLNLEYKDVKYGNTKFQKAGPLTVSTDLDARDKAWIGSVTFPLEL